MNCPARCGGETRKLNIDWCRPDLKPEEALQCTRCKEKWYVWPMASGKKLFISVSEYERRRKQEFDPQNPASLIRKMMREYM